MEPNSNCKPQSAPLSIGTLDLVWPGGLGSSIFGRMAPDKLADGTVAWWRSTLALGFGGSLLLGASFPPIGFSWLAWFAPLPWLVLIQRDSFSGRRPYLLLWLVSLFHWLAMLQGIRLAYWVLHFGWFALSAYLAAYLPLFVALARFATRRAKLPLVVAAPVIWTGLELARGYLFTGFSMALLGHTQFENTAIIQIADLGGAYAVSFLIMTVCAALTSAIGRSQVRKLWPLGIAATLLAATVMYGWYRIEPVVEGSQGASTGLKVALIQSAFNTRFEFNPERNREIFLKFLQLTREVRNEHPDVDLIVWPESVFTENFPELLLDADVTAADGLTRERLLELAASFRQKAVGTAKVANSVGDDEERQDTNIHLLVGTESWQFSGSESQHHNSALLINPSGKVIGRYYKMHPVMFGEYIPLGSVIPFIYKRSPMAGGLTPGSAPAAFELDSIRLSPSICFESAVPHLIRRQVRALDREGLSPDVLVNVTHDGWFWGSSILDFQLAGAVFRAVELRRPFLVAANAGISAWIDDSGRIRARGPRQGDAKLIATVGARQRHSPYEMTGDLAAGICFCVTSFLAAWALRTRFLPHSR
jgi:apolipoprotein N-acyltransferase